MLQWWLGAVVVCLAATVALAAWLVRRGVSGPEAVPASALARLRSLPAYAAVVRGQVRARTVEVVALAVAVLGMALLVSRWVGISDDDSEMRTRDVVLCMDVSASMVPVVADVVDTYVQLSEALDGERIGFVMFDGNAVTAFPLTDDYEYVRTALLGHRNAIEAGTVAGVAAARSGTSLVGDGLASCVQHFDRAEEPRSRTVVLATDNLVSGDSIYSLGQATDLAVAGDAMVYAIVPERNQPDATAELRHQTRRTGGDVLVVDPEDQAVTVVIQEAVTRQQKQRIVAAARLHSFDQVWPGGLLLVLGLTGSLLTGWRDLGRRRTR